MAAAAAWSKSGADSVLTIDVRCDHRCESCSQDARGTSDQVTRCVMVDAHMGRALLVPGSRLSAKDASPF